MSAAETVEYDFTGRAGRISDSDVLSLRRAYFNDGRVSEAEADRLLKLALSYEGESDAWPNFFVEVLSDYVVYQAEPCGYVSDEQAQWLMKRVARTGHIQSGAVLEMLVKVLEAATEVPEALAAFALSEVKHAVLSGNCKLIGDAGLKPGVIGKAEVDLLRRVLYAAAGDRNVAISRSEAEVLFDLNDATVDAHNHSSWPDLFAKAIVNHLMAANNYRAMSREDALRIRNWMDAPSAGVFGFVSKMFTSEMASLKDVYRDLKREDPEWSRLERMYVADAEAEQLTAGEVSWVAERIGRNGRLDETEQALLRFIRDECPQIHPGLEGLLAKL